MNEIQSLFKSTQCLTVIDREMAKPPSPDPSDAWNSDLKEVTGWVGCVP